MTVWRMRVTYFIRNGTDTHTHTRRIRILNYLSTATMVTCKRLEVTLYVQCLFLLLNVLTLVSVRAASQNTEGQDVKIKMICQSLSVILKI